MRHGLGLALGVAVGLAGFPAAASEPATTTLAVEGMTCGGCVAAVKLQLKRTEGVTSYGVSLELAEAEVRYDPARTTPETIAESVSRTGFKASVKEPVEHEGERAGRLESRPEPSPQAGKAGFGPARLP